MRAHLQSVSPEVAVSAESAAAHFRIPADYPYLEGHFPGMPIVPGVVQVAWSVALVEAFLGRALTQYSLSRFKFIAPILPGAEVSALVEPEPGGRFRIAIEANGALVSKGHLIIPQS